MEWKLRSLSMMDPMYNCILPINKQGKAININYCLQKGVESSIKKFPPILFR